MAAPLWNVPNILTLSRLPLTVLLCACIAERCWLAAFVVFVVASLTDWLDGWWARRYNQFTIFGRTFDPLIDKVLVGGAFIYLLDVPEAWLSPWMVTVVIGRELLITGVRGYIEALGKKFGADWFGKLKMVLQCVVLLVIFAVLAMKQHQLFTDRITLLETVQQAVIVLMLVATIGSGLQYCWKAARLARTT